MDDHDKRPIFVPVWSPNWPTRAYYTVTCWIGRRMLMRGDDSLYAETWWGRRQDRRSRRTPGV